MLGRSSNLWQVGRQCAEFLGIDAYIMEAVVDTQLAIERLRLSIGSRPRLSNNILLAGSGRSGTTWLAKILASVPGTQGIFEPLHPRLSDVPRLTGWSDDRVSRVRLRYLDPDRDYPSWHFFLHRVLSGEVRAACTDYGRRTSYAPRRFLIKAIRANLMLGYISTKFEVRIVYLVRHPCAVVCSRLSNGWLADVADLLSQEELVEDHLRPHLSRIEKEKDLVGAHAVWWAVENAVARQQLQGRPNYEQSYEGLLIDPIRCVGRMLDWLDLPHAAISGIAVHQPARRSPTTISHQSTQERLSNWTRYLSKSDQRRILEWACRLGVHQYDEGALPVTLRSNLHEPANSGVELTR